MNATVNKNNIFTTSDTWWSSLRHGGLLLSPRVIQEHFSDSIELPNSRKMEILRRKKIELESKKIKVSDFFRYVREEILELRVIPVTEGKSLDSSYAVFSPLKENLKPDCILNVPSNSDKGHQFAVFFTKDGERPGVGRGKKYVADALTWLRRKKETLGLVIGKDHWRLVYAGADFDAYTEWDVRNWFLDESESAGLEALLRLLGKTGFATYKELKTKLYFTVEESRKAKADLSDKLGENVRTAVEKYLTSFGKLLEKGINSGDFTSQDAYVAGVRMIMRLVVVLFAESRKGLLPLSSPSFYDSYSIGGLKEDLARRSGGREKEEDSDNPIKSTYQGYSRILSLFRLLYFGSSHENLTVPRYGGGLFSPGREDGSGIERALYALETDYEMLNDAKLNTILNLITTTRAIVRQGGGNKTVTLPVDFSDFGSDYIGILYEGLLDFELKQVKEDDPILFLNTGKQPALPLSRLEKMDEKSLKSLLDKMSKVDKSALDDTGEDSSEDEENEEDESEDESSEVENSSSEELNLEESDESLDIESDETGYMDRYLNWAKRILIIKKQIKELGSNASSDEQISWQKELIKKARSLLAREILKPREWYLVRWGGTRKGSGVYYTKPGLAIPTIRRLLEPLVRLGDAMRSPEEILKIKFCDPACGSGSFLLSALRYITQALWDSLQEHGWIKLDEEGRWRAIESSQQRPEWFKEIVNDLPVLTKTNSEDWERKWKIRIQRQIVENCIYGVDLDELAVELTRLSLWVETMDASLPFDFLDHKVKAGNSLIGTWFNQFSEYPLQAWERDGGDLKYKYTNASNKIYSLGKEGYRNSLIKSKKETVKNEMEAYILSYTSLPFTKNEDNNNFHKSLEDIYSKMHHLALKAADEKTKIYLDMRNNQSSPYNVFKKRFDLWCAIWFWDLDELDTCPLPSSFLNPSDEVWQKVAIITNEYKFFHWELEFPDVFNSERQGFDAIGGNPPWETLQPEKNQYFSNIDPLFRTYSNENSKEYMKGYFNQDHHIEIAWIKYKEKYKAFNNFFKGVSNAFGDPQVNKNNVSLSKPNLHAKWRPRRDQLRSYLSSPVPYTLQGSGKKYSHKLFLELSYSILSANGRLGIIIPSGLYTDYGMRDIRREFLENSNWEWLYSFENRNKIFSSVDGRFKFCPIILEKGKTTLELKTAFMRRDLEEWNEVDGNSSIILNYTLERIKKFSPNTLSILELTSREAFEIINKIYENGILLGDQSESGWRVKYQQGDFNMTSDSKLFPELSKWEAQGYKPDEYGHWLKGNWQSNLNFEIHRGKRWIFPRPNRAVYSRDFSEYILLDGIEDVALPLYEGRMIGQFDFSQKGWVSGKARTAKWREIYFDGSVEDLETGERIPMYHQKMIEPQYLMGIGDYSRKKELLSYSKIAFMDIASATNMRTMIATFGGEMPFGNSAPILNTQDSELLFPLNSLSYDYLIRKKTGGLHLNYHVIEDTSVPNITKISSLTLKHLYSLQHTSSEFSYELLNKFRNRSNQSKFKDFDIESILKKSNPFRSHWAVTPHERLRIRCILDAVSAEFYGLEWKDFAYILKDCDHPLSWLKTQGNSASLDAKGFWRVDKEKEAWFRHTVLSLVAFHDLKEKSLDAFLEQNDGEGWMLPETLRLADYGLGQGDESANTPQVVREALGERFYDWQLAQDPKESWEECAMHAENIRTILRLDQVTFTDSVISDVKKKDESEKVKKPKKLKEQPGLF
ncbi:Eco57I restriction-modification methylase domain-containing protein [Leptospira bandrabouensis]|uniref:site-specific DNA-methyltransferase (adenine-specific) n=1 Tax=Leptospira bandrabouensis TaxID=2484903 RepID=A0A6H3NPZ9_9LEPT|nr:DNA methyltransferase [Leptospira bandrabouensis]TGN11619.1 hypothetical protein EHR08_17150 [Leptospira bandrabouensis]